MLEPAHFTKHVPLLALSFQSAVFAIAQLDDGRDNGTAVWLAGQALAIVLPALLGRRRGQRAIELGSGTGFTALALCSLGWDVVATDTRAVLSAVLQRNIDANRRNLPAGAGTIQTRELDWTVAPAHWTWSHPSAIASHDYIDADTPAATLHPPFDLILTADTLYSPQLVGPLLAALRTLSAPACPPIYLALERRDPRLAEHALEQARADFSVQRVPDKKVARAIVKARCRWDRVEWEGVEVWKLVRRTAAASSKRLGKHALPATRRCHVA